MTNLKSIATTCLAVSGLALAQDYPAASSYPAASTASTATRGAVTAPRTGLYESVTKSNAAADNTVDDFSRRPTLIGDKQYFAGYGGADMGNAAFSFGGMGWNWFGQVSGPVDAGTGVPNTLRLGLGRGTAWGGGLLLAVNRVYDKTAAGDETTTYFETSGIGAFGDFNLGAGDVYGQIGWNTGFPLTPPAGHNSVTTDPAAGSETTLNNHGLSLMGGWKKDATTEGTHAFNIEASYLMAMHNDDAPTPDVDDKANILSLFGAWGYVLRATPDYAVFVGTNAGALLAYDDVAPMSGSRYSLSLTPNIAFQKQLGHGFEGFSGFAVTGSYSSAKDEPADGAEHTQLLTGGADVAVGLRWVKDNLAFEGSLKEAVLANGPYLIGGNAGQGLFVDIGLALGI